MKVLLVATLSALTAVAPSGEGAYRHVVDYAALASHHRTGTPEGDATTAWFADRLADAGAQVELQPFTFDRYVVERASITVGEGALSPEVLPFHYSGSTGPDGVTAELFDGGYGSPLELQGAAGKIVVLDVPMPAPGFVPSFARAVAGARSAGAAAVIAAVQGPANALFGINADARNGMCDLPVLVVGKRDGSTLRALRGRPATFVLDAHLEENTVNNVLGWLPGTTDDVLVIGTPLHGWFTAATERGTGIGTLLEVARGLAARPSLPQTVLFVGTAGHEVGFLGLEAFIRDNPSLLSRVSSYVHLGATLAAYLQRDVADSIVTTGLPEAARALIVSENPVLQAHSAAAFAQALPVAPVPPASGQGGEQQFMYEAGVPTVSISGTSLWFHTPGDLPSGTDPALLDPMVRAFTEVTDALLASDPATVRTANAAAQTLAPFLAEGEGGAVEGCSG